MQVKLNSTTIKSLNPRPQPYEAVDTEIKGFLLRVQPTGRKTFYFSYRSQAGKRKRIKVGVLGAALTLAQARDKARILAGQVANGIDVQQDKATNREQVKKLAASTLDIFIKEHYAPWAIANLKSGNESIASIKRSFPDYLSLPMVDITVKRIEQWRTQKLSEGLKPSTINRVVNALRGVLTKAVLWQVLDTHPLSNLKALKLDESKRNRYLSDDETNRLFAALAARDERLKAERASGNAFRSKRGYALLPDLSGHAYGDRLTPMVLLSLKTGLRRGELFDLYWSDIDFSTNVLTVRGEIAKSSKTRHIPLSKTAQTALQSWLKQAPTPDGRIFPANDGGRLNNVKSAWTALLKSAGINQFRWHDMRHDFASKLVMKGVPLNTVRELCGHADLNTTLRYAHLAPDHKADAVQLLG